ncbi:hypothetical protein BU17DRAFT_47713, partial [Hysterangium stoloniferum]
ELQEYLDKPVENIKDPLKWWVANQHVYPSCIALLSFIHSQLHILSICAFLCLSSWDHDDLVFIEDILVAVISNLKRKRESFEVKVK